VDGLPGAHLRKCEIIRGQEETGPDAAEGPASALLRTRARAHTHNTPHTTTTQPISHRLASSRGTLPVCVLECPPLGKPWSNKLEFRLTELLS